MIKKVKLGEQVEFQRGYDLTHNDMKDGEYPVVGSTSVIGYHDEYKATDGIVIGRSGTVGKPQLIRGKYWPHNTALFTTDIKGNSLEYLYYMLINIDIGKMKTGSNIPTLNRNDLYPLEIPFETDLHIQKDIAKTLATIDDKISNNNSICSDLESMAKLLYDYWFVQFDFPDENGKPYKSSGGKMVWNKELKREIPEGWKVGTLGVIANTKLGGTPDTKTEKYWNGCINWLNSGEVAESPVLESEKTITEEGMNNSATSFSKSGAIVMSITRYIRPSILGIDACYNQSVVAIEPNEIYHTAYLYPFLLSQVDRYMQLRTGAQQPHINKEIVDKTIIILPSRNILKQYYFIAEKLYEEQMIKAKETKELASLRDFLLPMLMNGQVKVGKEGV